MGRKEMAQQALLAVHTLGPEFASLGTTQIWSY